MALLTGRRPLGQVLRQMVRHKDHTKAIFAGMGAYLKATPALVDALQPAGPGDAADGHQPGADEGA